MQVRLYSHEARANAHADAYAKIEATAFQGQVLAASKPSSQVKVQVFPESGNAETVVTQKPLNPFPQDLYLESVGQLKTATHLTGLASMGQLTSPTSSRPPIPSFTAGSLRNKMSYLVGVVLLVGLIL
ncbi:hypothetical protein NEOLI_005327 [Neolecta irregularis DAH-3]|uniref:Uncharacterized protein n=1 Tax=Neolecta irregularis (strain DAH-3) TaxID=1198029 RepID=A0A1U7LRN3_NEOID|nr:hypothetical protein NEOLI_005327 [Neolecta irregularis DAH-3]|eukprot:OLL25317.1 hypothetical protein NEOLI_005327 [Neolecta irregularis DAH-3]